MIPDHITEDAVEANDALELLDASVSPVARQYLAVANRLAADAHRLRCLAIHREQGVSSGKEAEAMDCQANGEYICALLEDRTVLDYIRARAVVRERCRMAIDATTTDKRLGEPFTCRPHGFRSPLRLFVTQPL